MKNGLDEGRMVKSQCFYLGKMPMKYCYAKGYSNRHSRVFGKGILIFHVLIVFHHNWGLGSLINKIFWLIKILVWILNLRRLKDLMFIYYVQCAWYRTRYFINVISNP